MPLMLLPNRGILKKLRALNWSDWRDLARAEAALGQTQLLVWLLPRGKLLAKSHQAEGREGQPLTDVPDRIHQLAQAVARASRYGPLRPSCLIRAIALQRLIERAGYSGSRVRVGVRLGGTQLEAHAWVDYMGIPIGDDISHVGQFEEISPLELRGR